MCGYRTDNSGWSLRCRGAAHRSGRVAEVRGSSWEACGVSRVLMQVLVYAMLTVDHDCVDGVFGDGDLYVAFV